MNNEGHIRVNIKSIKRLIDKIKVNIQEDYDNQNVYRISKHIEKRRKGSLFKRSKTITKEEAKKEIGIFIHNTSIYDYKKLESIYDMCMFGNHHDSMSWGGVVNYMYLSSSQCSVLIEYIRKYDIGINGILLTKPCYKF